MTAITPSEAKSAAPSAPPTAPPTTAVLSLGHSLDPDSVDGDSSFPVAAALSLAVASAVGLADVLTVPLTVAVFVGSSRVPTSI